MEGVIKALLDEGVSAEQFSSFAVDNGISDLPEIQETLQELILREVDPSTPRPWTSSDTDDLLEFLKSPEKSRPPL